MMIEQGEAAMESTKSNFFFHKNCVSKVNILFFADTV